MLDSENLSAAYDALVSTLRELGDEGRATMAARVNQRMRSSRGFDVTSAGFRSFKAFLESARDRGLVEFDENPGTDLLVRVPSTLLEHPPATSPQEGQWPLRIRPDLWRAFLDTRVGYRHVFDRAQDRVFAFPENRQVEIDPIPAEIQQRWRLDFAETLEDEARRDRVRAAAATSNQEFIEALGDALPLYNRFRLEQVTTAIHQWVDDRSVKIELHSEPPLPRPFAVPLSPPKPSEVPSATGNPLAGHRPETIRGQLPILQMRERLKAVIDVMALADLARLPIPAEYLLREGDL